MNKEKIREVLRANGIEETDELVDALSKEISLQTVPKDKYNDVSKRVTSLEEEKGEIEKELSELKKQSMTADELVEAKEKELNDKISKLAMKENELEITKILSKNGITEETYGEDEYKELLVSLVSDDKDASEKKTNNFVNILTKAKEKTEQETTTRLLKETPKPKTGTDGSGVVTKEQFDAMTYSQMMNFMQESPELYAEYTK